MYFAKVIAASAVVLPALVSAHGDGLEGVPKIFGRHNIPELKARSVFGKRSTGHAKEHFHEKKGAKAPRANAQGQCGAAYGACSANQCCSGAGWCGTGTEYCAAPDSQWQYGPAADANQIPPGTNTSTVARTRLSKVLYGGEGIYDCVNANQIALTFDDGPYIYTDHVLDLLTSYGAKATFFITGNNLGKGEIDNAYYGWNTVIQKMYNNGNQIASHTWSHQDLDSLTSAQRKDQIYKNEMAIRNIIQKFPTYMRPPYSSCSAACQTDMYNLGYHITYFDLDTDDYDNTTPDKIQTSKDYFLSNITSGISDNWLTIAHDIHQQTAYNLTEYMLQTLQQNGYTAVTLGQCLGDSLTNWYRDSAGSVFTKAPTTTTSTTSTTTSPTVSPTAASNNGQCGGTTGFTCVGSGFGDCCSPAGWCGTGTDYCGTGCQSAFGTCGTSTATSTAATVTPTKASTDGKCGGTTGETCIGSGFGNCCSSHGWCGSTTDYCGTGCQPVFGTCS